ncbi:DUF5034 domain-containing protein [Flavilitoribacter nigricans]|uniref:DUF5034 domain-containing protein n=1 Tax=Flavilitoribacter nigricans (strain ATCC 23147 / DSM 23189 / NBRC 102662 / NCIMB 1420 / SS-2) TaxID=1122177 RepID=A0A2D0N6U4_FLAN2|nr:DUF5034 domain-containing protein [Flavilitoribacter nigricans]PHN04187.1 hypothetical protein CRP01_23625 [Flavilitoribacter nigricans DSM 23189 = NBRC 102662]
MKWNKVLVVLLIPVAVNILSSCCECLESMFFDYTNCSISVEELDNSRLQPEVSSNKMILKEAFGLRVNVERKQDLCHQRSTPLFVTSAFAFSCECPPETVFQPLDSILTIQITTLRDFDDTHLSGSDVSEYFSVLLSTEFISIDEFISNLRNEVYDLEYDILKFDLMLMTPPPATGAHQFAVSLELSDGRVLSKSSSIIDLL